MKAVVSSRVGGPETLTVAELPTPQAGPHDLLLAVRAAGVNYPDGLIIEDRYQYRPERPFAPGGEAAGVVVQVGAAVTGFKVGDRVAAYCGWGGMAERLAVPAVRCVPLPDVVPFAEGAAFLFTYGTAHYALTRRGQLQRGDKVLVLGAAGGVGIAAVEIAQALGAEVIAACSSSAKVAFCQQRGAQHGLVYPSGELDRDAQRAFTEQIRTVAGGPVDIVLDAVGGSYAEPALRALGWEGRYLVLGFPAGLPAIPLNLPLLKSCDIRGVFWGAWVDRDPAGFRAGAEALFALYAAGKVKPAVSRVYPLAAAGEAIRALQAREVMGKLVVEVAAG